MDYKIPCTICNDTNTTQITCNNCNQDDYLCYEHKNQLTCDGLYFSSKCENIYCSDCKEQLNSYINIPSCSNNHRHCSKCMRKHPDYSEENCPITQTLNTGIYHHYYGCRCGCGLIETNEIIFTDKKCKEIYNKIFITEQKKHLKNHSYRK